MSDPYEPPLAEFAFTEEEQAAIDEALQQPRPWSWKPVDKATRDALRAARKRIRAYHLARHGENCCYCRVNLHGGGPFMTDPEHVLPKNRAEFRPYSFTMWNLAASCKRCNMEFKRTNYAFVVDRLTPAAFNKSANYLLLHPNFDRYEDHIVRSAVQHGTHNIVAYRSSGSDKAEYTIEMFQLRNLQTESFDEAQGIETTTPESKFVLEARELVKRYNQ